jgi:diguanylate cyclase (GGDEF)-like protein/PAS domain S-box-containing protein
MQPPGAALSWELIAIAGSLAILVVLLLGAWRYRRHPTGRWFLAFVACAAIWTAGYLLELTVPSLAGKIFWTRVQFVGIAFLPLMWLGMVLTYLGKPISRRLRWMTASEPIATVLLVSVVPLPNWFWGMPTLTAPAGVVARIDYDYQWWFYFVHAPFGYLLLAATALVTFCAMMRMNRGYRTPLILLIVAMAIPLISDVVYISGYSPSARINPTTMVMSISGLIIGFVLRRYHFLTVVPVARSIIFDTMNDGVVVLDRSGYVVDINPAAIAMCGCEGRVVGRLIRDASPSELAVAVKEMLATGERVREVSVGSSETTAPHVYEVGLSPLIDRAGAASGAIFTVRDVTDRVHLYQQVRRLSMLDDLTGVFNRRSLLEAGGRELDLIRRGTSSSLGVLLIDLDNFKSINDNFGHAAGDAVLQAVANGARGALRSVDILGRIGGDEFAVILPGTGDDDAHRAAGRLREAIAGLAITSDGRSIPVTASIGTATSERYGADPPQMDQLLNDADAAMYRAKRAGKNRVG